MHSSENESESEPSLDILDDEDLANRLSHSTKSKIMIRISAEDLVDCTAVVSARYRVGIRPQTSIVAAICNKAGVNLEDIILSRSTVHRTVLLDRIISSNYNYSDGKKAVFILMENGLNRLKKI